MAIKTVEEFVGILKSGKYESSVNAQRAAGRTQLSAPAKKRVFEAIASYFKNGPHPGASSAYKAAKTSKKKTSKKTKRLSIVPVLAAADPSEAAARSKKKAPKKKKASAKGKLKSKGPVGTLSLSPNQVDSVADVLRVIDSTVNSSVSIIAALQKADALNSSFSIEEGVNKVKEALVGTAQLLNQSVIMPLSNAGPQTNPEVAGRLEQVMSASHTAAAQIYNGQAELPPPPALPNITLSGDA